MRKGPYFIVNGITLYRLLAAFLLLLLLFYKRLDLFKWLLPLSFFTDAIDGFLARKYKTASILGSKLDSIADQFTIIAAIAGMFIFRGDFVRENVAVIAVVLGLYFIQTVLALIRYNRISSFHTYLAKIAAILSGIFLILLFLLPEPLYPLFYVMAILTGIELLEEIILVFVLPEWQADVKGLYWILQKKR
ncbi:CDP-alcohol phosphatidyltransferase family protein [Pontibacter sp. KCTC 32443]|uniref:CDP-alcohol phosphatidyltransferase family protein n=1 Tax=Pontibacter TaxID=323449 RepID=UPI00164D55F2|nr:MULTISPECIES: CDP-alcohol phosphatidyltransferase family protein [Pontibacter]MBC5774638.1 CDP-alcohol phosphatidyltransferase family protein [Pontibacter sp. KCTC 32443]